MSTSVGSAGHRIASRHLVPESETRWTGEDHAEGAKFPRPAVVRLRRVVLAAAGPEESSSGGSTSVVVCRSNPRSRRRNPASKGVVIDLMAGSRSTRTGAVVARRCRRRRKARAETKGRGRPDPELPLEPEPPPEPPDRRRSARRWVPGPRGRPVRRGVGSRSGRHSSRRRGVRRPMRGCHAWIRRTGRCGVAGRLRGRGTLDVAVVAMPLLEGDPGADREHRRGEHRPALRAGSAEQGGRGAAPGHSSGRAGRRGGGALGEQGPEYRKRDQRADGVAELRPGAEDQAADGGGRRAELGRDLAVADALELPFDQGLALSLGEGAHGDDEAVELVPLLGDVARVGVGGERFVELVDSGLSADRVRGRRCGRSRTARGEALISRESSSRAEWALASDACTTSSAPLAETIAVAKPTSGPRYLRTISSNAGSWPSLTSLTSRSSDCAESARRAIGFRGWSFGISVHHRVSCGGALARLVDDNTTREAEDHAATPKFRDRGGVQAAASSRSAVASAAIPGGQMFR